MCYLLGRYYLNVSETVLVYVIFYGERVTKVIFTNVYSILCCIYFHSFFFCIEQFDTYQISTVSRYKVADFKMAGQITNLATQHFLSNTSCKMYKWSWWVLQCTNTIQVLQHRNKLFHKKDYIQDGLNN